MWPAAWPASRMGFAFSALKTTYKNFFLSENEQKTARLIVELRTKFFGLVLLGAAVNSSALTLGRVRGAAVIGQPLDLSVQAQLDADENMSALCVDADVFHADSRQDSSRVRVTVEPTQQAQSVNFRVQSSVAIDEPMITVYLRAGCTQKMTRRYVLLADFPSDSVVSSSSPSLAAAPATPVDGAAAASAAAAGGAAATAVASKPPAAAQPPKPVVKAPPKAKPVAAEKAPAKPKAAAQPVQAPAPASTAQVAEKHSAGRDAGQSRLKLDPLVSLTERVASLESSSSIPAAEIQREVQKLETLEGSVKALLALAAKNEASMMEMKLRLQKAESDRMPAEWVYGLVALLIACLGGLIFMWTRLRQGAAALGRNEWWGDERGSPAVAGHKAAQNASQFSSVDPSAPAPVGASTPAALARRKTTGAGELEDPTSEMDVSLVEMSESNFDKLMQSGQAHTALRRGPLPSPVPVQTTQVQAFESMRSINSEQLFDVRQQAEFFVSLGQTDQAVRILENRISDNGESSPLIYLDLLKIFYTLGLKTDFHQFREDFNLLFNGRVPEFAHFKDEGKSLEEYPHLLAHIGALWSRPNVLKVIEASIFRDPLDDKSAPFDLAAFKDLLLLHAIAQTNFNPDATMSRPMPLTVVSAGSEDDNLKTMAGFARVAPVAESTELDVDLSDLEFSAPTASNPLVATPPASAPSPLAQSMQATQAMQVGNNTLPEVDSNLLNFDLPDTGSVYTLPKPKN
jgi:pilus assembly protein FimV